MKGVDNYIQEKKNEIKKSEARPLKGKEGREKKKQKS